MAYASLDDVNAHLPTDKIVAEQSDLETLGLDAERIIRGQVGSVISMAEIQQWVDPSHTPELIRSIVGRLIAAAIYAKAVSENMTLVPEYAQNLYNQAMGYLMGIRSGSQVIVDIDGNTIVVNKAELSDDYISVSDTPKFTINQAFS